MFASILTAALVVVLIIGVTIHDRVDTTMPTRAAKPARIPNPYTIGSPVIVNESLFTDNAIRDISAAIWSGTYMGMSNGLAVVRDNETFATANVDRAIIFPIGTVF